MTTPVLRAAPHAASGDLRSTPARCACGSGLRRDLCCDLVIDAASGADAHPLPLMERAWQAHQAGGTEAAETLCLHLLEQAPTRVDALRLLHAIRKVTGPPSALEPLLRRLVTLAPNDVAACVELGCLLLDTGRFAEAERHARNAVRLAPDAVQTHSLLAMVLTEGQRPHWGEHHYRMAMRLSGTRDPILLANLAWNLKGQGRMSEARQLYQESVALAPNVPQTLLGWARLEEADRRFEAATDLLDGAEAAFPGDPRFQSARAVLLRRQGRYGEALAILDGIAGRRAGDLAAHELLEKGAVLDRLDRTDEAFEAFAAGKRKAREAGALHYRADEAQSLATRLKTFFSAGRLARLPRAGIREDGAQPVFVLGFPRSGTTLVEQMLSAHPRIAAGDELPIIGDIIAGLQRRFDSPLSYPDALAELWMADHASGLDELRDHYLRRVAQFGVTEKRGATRFTDKMPLNEMHLGLIALMFPAAPLIHVIRHPLDVVLSVFAHDLTHGFACAYELETIARHYVLIMELVQHYRREMSVRYLPVRYEALVDDPASSLRRMLAFVGEDYDARCLRFEENERRARTASYAQVTEPLYDRSRFRYRRYIRHLEPVIPILQPVIEHLGYTVAAAS
ncbi:MAG: sulfotransferase [Acetobacteraceae bacterium]|nr:sulfotransferase [Acetobacteraceae bacterium]